MIKITNLKVEVEDKLVLDGVSLNMEEGKKVLLMGPNGSGKTTLARVLLGDKQVKVVSGRITMKEESGKEMDLLKLDIDERAQRGIFVGFQHPVEIPGVGFYEFLLSAHREVLGEEAINIDEFYKNIDQIAKTLQIEPKLASRNINEGLSGGEKKKMELLQMVVMKPKYVILDEPDSGLDADSVKIVKKAIEELEKNVSVLIISHDAKRLGMKDFDQVLVMKSGKIVKTGGNELIDEVAKKGYEEV